MGMRISIRQGTMNGPSVYTETHSPTSNANGLVTLQIGAGSVVTGDFAAIDWANGPYYLRTETDPAGGVDYSITGTTQLLSVPYALHAAQADSASSLVFPSARTYNANCGSNWTLVDLSEVVGPRRAVVRLKVIYPQGGGYSLFKASDDQSDYIFGTDTNNTLALTGTPGVVGQVLTYTGPTGAIRLKCSPAVPVDLIVLYYQF